MSDIKMGDVFDFPISHNMDELRDCHGKELAAFNTCKQDEYAAHAISSHDALVEQNKALRAALAEVLHTCEVDYAIGRGRHDELINMIKDLK